MRCTAGFDNRANRDLVNADMMSSYQWCGITGASAAGMAVGTHRVPGDRGVVRVLPA